MMNSPSLTPADWPGAVNAWQVRPGLWRMGRAEWVEREGWEAMARDGVGAVVDLRLPNETPRSDIDPDDVHVPPSIRRIAAPVEDADHREYRELAVPYVNHPRLYADLVGFFPQKVARALRIILDEWRDGGVVVHCSAGRDRTGLATAMLLQLEEVPGGAADWEEQRGNYATGVLGMNEFWRTTTLTHPHERYLEERQLSPLLDERLEALRVFLADWPGERVARLMETGEL
ncbi:MAG: tyrosine-protein phosphatase [Propionibacterium sp.]|nr:tyrosine-protein phosphatase [Propionibacterium sp.]